jgi:hypothetical protein
VAIGCQVEAGLSVVDDHNSFKSSYAIGRDTLILIRPDGYVGQIAITDRVAAIACTVAARAFAKSAAISIVT